MKSKLACTKNSAADMGSTSAEGKELLSQAAVPPEWTSCRIISVQVFSEGLIPSVLQQRWEMSSAGRPYALAPPTCSPTCLGAANLPSPAVAILWMRSKTQL